MFYMFDIILCFMIDKDKQIINNLTILENLNL